MMVSGENVWKKGALTPDSKKPPGKAALRSESTWGSVKPAEGEKMLNRLVSSFAYRAARTQFGGAAIVRAASEQFGSVAYRRLHQMGFRPGSIVDIGAHQGDWTREIREIFDAPTLMIEARKDESVHLKQATRDLRDTSYAIALLGSQPSDSVRFAISATGSSLFEEQSNAERHYEDIPMVRLDDVVRGHKLKPPFFLKLDVQGAELEVLNGGFVALANSEVVQLEVPFLNYNKGAPTAIEVMGFMDAADFAPFDISGFIRPDGVSLAQVDILFVKKTSPLRRQFFKF